LALLLTPWLFLAHFLFCVDPSFVFNKAWDDDDAIYDNL